MHCTDSAGRTPLIIACMQNYDKGIIKQILSLDHEKSSVLTVDCFGSTPLHYACSNKDANVDVVNMLLDAEAEYQDQQEGQMETIRENTKQNMVKKKSYSE